MTNDGLSLVDVAEIILKEKKEALNIYEIYDAVCIKKGIAEEDKDKHVAQFYSDVTVSAKFVYVGDNTWDIKSNQKIELWEKDGSFYKEYTEVVIPPEYLEKEVKATPKKADPVVKKAAKVVAKPVAKVVEEVVVKEEVIEAVEEVVEAVIVEPVVEPVVEVSTDAKAKVGTAEDGSEEFEEELFDDFDEEKYNEYMDTYEDQYKD